MKSASRSNRVNSRRAVALVQIGQMELVLTEDVEKKTWQDCLRELYDRLLHKEQPQTSGAEA